MDITAAMGAAMRSRYGRICRLHIEPKQGRTVPFDRPYSEQVRYLDAVNNPLVKSIAVVKARKLGLSTAHGAHTFDESMLSDYALKTVIATNHSDTTRSWFRRAEVFHQSLPRPLRRMFPAAFNRTLNTVEFGRNKALIDHITMGGKSGGRSWTYQRGVCDEVAWWPNARQRYAALRGTVDDSPETRWAYISTPNGPGDLFHERVLAFQDAVARGDPSVALFFFPWQEHPQYRKRPPDGWTPSDDDLEYGAEFGLDVEQMYWRWSMVYGVDGMGLEQFKKEFPATLDDAFTVREGAWFDIDFVCKVLDALPREKVGEERIYKRRVSGRRYAAGIDPAWCNGGDNAVCQIVDDRGEQVAVLSMNQGGEQLFAMRASELCMRYRAKVLIEANPGGAGTNVKRQFLDDGHTLWKTTTRTAKERPKDWTTAGGNKRQAMADLRQMVNGDFYDLHDHQTLREMKTIREEGGTIEGRDSAKDDHVMALALAEQCRRSLPSARMDMPGSRRTYTRNPRDLVASARW